MTGTDAHDEGVLCTCRHPRGAHEHYRRGSDCSLCGCPRFRRDGLLRRLLARTPPR